jgi:polysaccharide biosynthesis/export protein
MAAAGSAEISARRVHLRADQAVFWFLTSQTRPWLTFFNALNGLLMSDESTCSRHSSVIGRLLTLFFLTLGFSVTTDAQGSDTTYVIRANDAIRLAVYEEPDLSVQVRVLKTGQASFPLIGSVEVAGLSVAAAAAKIRDLYARDYLVDPKLTLTVDDYATEFISVIGSVKQPGQIQIPASGNIDLGSAIATAGGLLETADPNAVQVVRAGGSTRSFTLSAIQGAAGRTALAAGDRVIVNESRFVNKFVTILGPVAKPGAIPFPLDGRLDLVTAVAIAGGFTDLANTKKVSINRGGQVTLVNFREVARRGNRSFLLQPGDVITVAERLF